MGVLAKVARLTHAGASLPDYPASIKARDIIQLSLALTTGNLTHSIPTASGATAHPGSLGAVVQPTLANNTSTSARWTIILSYYVKPTDTKPPMPEISANHSGKHY